MKIQRTVSDFDSELMEDHFHISIERPGFSIEYPKNCYTNRLEVDLMEDQIAPYLKKLVYHRMEISSSLIPERK